MHGQIKQLRDNVKVGIQVERDLYSNQLEADLCSKRRMDRSMGMSISFAIMISQYVSTLSRNLLL